MSFPRYPKYKASGVEWLGDVPAHWEVMPLRRLAKDERGSFIDGDWIEAPFITDDGVRLLQTGNVGIGAFKEQGFRYVSPTTFRDLGCTPVDPGDVLICRLAEPVGRACLAPDLGVPMITSVDVCILKPSHAVFAPFIVYSLCSASYLGFMEGQCRGGTRDRVSRSFLGAVAFAAPPREEQLRIAAFLDRETAKIDALVAEQQRLIELLKEKRQAVISHAVTKGLDPNAKMKPSGIEWLGDVPAHWAVVKMKSVAKMESGHTPDKKVPEYWIDGDIPWVSLNDTTFLKDNDYITDTAYQVSQLGIDNSSGAPSAGTSGRILERRHDRKVRYHDATHGCLPAFHRLGVRRADPAGVPALAPSIDDLRTRPADDWRDSQDDRDARGQDLGHSAPTSARTVGNR